MISVNNAIIRASAGSGKTYQLVRRYLRLLSLGVEPETIVAMTFTRKAAREFFERILQKLAELAADPSQALGYVDELAEPGKAMRLLRGMIRGMDRLRLGTIDSFFASIARCFPFELGLAGQASIMPEDETAEARADVMHALLVEVTRDTQGTALSEMLEAWKRATAGKELNRPSDYLEAWFDRLQDLYLEAPGREYWGAPEKIWPEKTAAIWKASDDLKQAIERLRDLLDVDAFGKIGDKWEGFYAAALARRPGEPIKGDAVEYMLKPDRCADPSLLRLGAAEWKMNKARPVLSRETGSALADVLDIIVGQELACRCQRAQGRRDVVARFDEHYARRVRGRGRLAFGDLTWLLAGRIQTMRAEPDWEARWEEMRREWEYRLDSRFGHWLFDEFQDTSRRQWRVVANLVDEAASDPEGRRSFFAVGDLKQSLYLWRQAEPELFLDVEKRYEHTRMEEVEPLVTSFRSSRQVLEMVNGVFDQKAKLREYYPDAMHWWSFEAHRASAKSGAAVGHAALLRVPADEDVDEKDARDELVASIIRHIAPLDRGLSCAVLTRSNDEAQRLSAVLRRLLRVEVVCESEVPVALDNPVSLVLLALFQVSAHPGDSMAEEHLRMSPLAAWLESNGSSALPLLGARVRAQIATEGFLATVRTWSEELRRAHGDWDAFSAWRLSQFADIAAEFDQKGSRDVDAFIAFARDCKLRAADQGRALQVMTVHKSKGLEFDVVVLPHLQSTALDQPMPSSDGENLLVQRDELGDIQWMLDKPPTLINQRDEALSAAVNQEKARLAYQGLCRLYVAMTRAKRGLYLVLPAKGNARSEADLLQQTLVTEKPSAWAFGEAAAECCYETGERGWFTQASATAGDAQRESAAATGSLREGLRSLRAPVSRLTPSGEESHQVQGRDLLSPQRERSRELGTLVHKLFEVTPWLDGEGAEALASHWRSLVLHGQAGFERASESVLRVLQNPEVLAWFNLGKGGREAWTERSFDMLHEGQWVSGVLDRVVLDRDGSGAWTQATILDFKTDAVADEAAMQARAAGYEPQMKLYRQAVARLTGVRLEHIRVGLVFCALGRIAWV